MEKVRLIDACQDIIHRCDTLDFPIFCSKDKKQAILQRERQEVDRAFDALQKQIGRDQLIPEQQRQDLWEQACVQARKEFSNLDEKHLLNGFYLQEVTHRYAELQANVLLQHVQ